ncbi:hypothetical protein Y900_020085 [Mycolicibacterium aromaticivorans JS19b1 = JCM 16368]|uniref:Uncharacterized protein n=1 Tax=Mycolicibacterium aromaticivorans JS19b1 = JCM 16368 TaxID=1440774 RepID=A0A064CQT1_9MYCO|nr:hypothetical protein Y900_020085 [Mycolicibacterium aromaticivorans JS19b1 = JCM 16368]
MLVWTVPDNYAQLTVFSWIFAGDSWLSGRRQLSSVPIARRAPWVAVFVKSHRNSLNFAGGWWG